MNWDRLQTYGLSSEKSFEMLCNQLFENWCKEAYKDSLFSFAVVNGAGGDGGVESYAVLKDNTIIGMQAKWFRSSIDASQINQIRGSLRTAKKVRPEITKYIVCVPRDLASKTAHGENTEGKRWNDFVSAMNTEFPDVSVELWNDARITAEMQKPDAAGIHKFWFTNSEIDSENLALSFSKAKSSWLSTKYVPDLNVPGQIRRCLSRYIGDFDLRYALSEKYSYIVDLCKQFETATNNLIAACLSTSPEMIELLSKPKEEIHDLEIESEKILHWLKNEYEERPIFEADAYFVSFDSIIEALRDSTISHTYHFHIWEIIKTLNKLSDIDYYDLTSETEAHLNNQSIIFLGNPGTGKTQGVGAFTEDLLKQQYHIPLIIQARSVPNGYNWKDIIVNTLGLSDAWSEDELWQALLSAANRKRFQDSYLQESISMCPKVLIIVDGVDESATYERWTERIKETTVINAKYPQIRFCFTSRPVAFSGPIDYANAIQLNDAGDTPVFKLFDSYTKAFNVSVQNCQWLKYALNTPLTLKLFCELHEGQSISISDLSEVSMDRLWHEKINRIQAEYNSKEGTSSRDQSIITAIIALSKCFVENAHTERGVLLSAIKEYCKVDNTRAEKLLDHLESYGIVGSFCKKGTGLSPDIYFYYTGIQGYFDYASAMYLIDKYKHPSAIDFEHCGGVDTNMLYCLAVLSIQQYQYLITRNPTIDQATNSFILFELQFYALQHSGIETAKQFRAQSLEIMQHGADSLVTIVNRLVLPLSRITGHPLGVSMLDEFLMGFDVPAHRDVVWSLPAYLRRADGKTWWKNEDIALLNDDDDEYSLVADDLADGLPIVYAWMLSNVNNAVRKKCRDKLMAWAQKTPQQFFMLFLHFADTNDPQIKSDLFSILMCLIYDSADAELTKEVSTWILSNVLAPSVIDQNRDISVRYYSIAIVEKAIIEGIFTEKEVEAYLPPYSPSGNVIALSKEALSGSRMHGYSAIDYDLARYVLVDHFDSDFNSWNNKQLDKFLNIIVAEQPDYSGITSEQFIISAAFSFVLQMGWSESEFYNYSKNKAGNYIGGADCSISASYHSATHGAQSNVMTICEKYVWQARNYISGFLCDRLLFGDDQVKLTDYSMLDDFLIPVQEMHQIDPDNIPGDRPWYIPEPLAVIPNSEFKSKEEITEYVKSAPDIDWAQWIQINNSDSTYAVPSLRLLALNLFSCFYGQSGVETDLFVNSIVLPEQEVSLFIKAVHDNSVFHKVCNPTDWNGGVESRCYITPKEVCWFPWKKHYDSYNAEEFPGLTIHSAVDRCCYNFPEYNDVYYSMPSALLRTLFGITDTDGYRYYDKDKNIVSEYSIAGEKWRTTQEYVLIGEDETLQKLHQNKLSLIWIMQELRRETGNAKERFGNFFAERRQYSIGYFKDGKFVVEKLISEFSKSQ